MTCYVLFDEENKQIAVIPAERTGHSDLEALARIVQFVPKRYPGYFTVEFVNESGIGILIMEINWKGH